MNFRHMIAVGVAAWPGVAAAADLRVAADIAPVHSLVALVMQDVGSPDLIVPPTASAHDHAMRPSEARALDEAAVVFWVGPALTPWLEGSVETLASDANVVTLMQVPGTVLLPFREGATFEAHDHDDHHKDHEDHAEHEEHKEHSDHDDHDGEHSDDHAHGHDDGTDPHVWLDPANARMWLPHIAATLAAADPGNAAQYTANAASAVARLDAVQSDLQTQLAPLKGKPFVVFHDAYHYFEARFGVEATGAISASDAEAPSPRRLREVQTTIRDTGAVCVFAEPGQNRAWVDAVAQDARVAELDPIGTTLQQSPDLYFDLLHKMKTALVDCLQD